MNRSRLVGLALGGGIVITLLTGLIPFRSLLGATHYGFPLGWLIRLVLAPEFFPWRVSWLGLVVDVFIWGTVVLAALLVYEQARNRSTGGQTP